MKAKICAGTGMLLGWLAGLFGGWDSALTTLVIFMSIDYISGVMVAGVFGNSLKSARGSLDSRAGWKGLCRKAITLALVLIAGRLDAVTGASYICDTVVIGFIVNESISIVENAKLMGIKLPAILEKAIDIIETKAQNKPGPLDRQ